MERDYTEKLLVMDMILHYTAFRKSSGYLH